MLSIPSRFFFLILISLKSLQVPTLLYPQPYLVQPPLQTTLLEQSKVTVKMTVETEWGMKSNEEIGKA